MRVTWTLQVSCAGNLDRFIVRVTWTLLGQASCGHCLNRLGNLDAAHTGFLRE